jgi:hypothetical protein
LEAGLPANPVDGHIWFMGLSFLPL